MVLVARLGGRANAAVAVASLLLVAIVAITYAPALGAPLIWDDHVLVDEDARCRGALWRCFSVPLFASSPFVDAAPLYYRPLVLLTLGLAPALGQGAAGQHALNVFLHALNAVLVLLVARRLGLGVLRATSAALVWAVFPRLADAVAWISGRCDVLATSFVLVGLACWPFESANTARGKSAAGGEWLKTAAACVAFLGALLSKETAVGALVAVAATTLALAPSRAALRRVAALGLPVLAYAALRFSALPARLPPSSLTPGVRVATVFEALGRYAEMIVRFHSPWSARGAIGVVDPARAVAGVALVGGVAWVAGRARRSKDPASILGIALAVATILPVSHLVPLALSGAVTADRMLYLPLVGLALAVASAVPSGRAGAIAFAMAFGASTLGSVSARATASAFRDEALFWVTVAERADRANVGPKGALASVIRDRGAPDLACRLFGGARAELERTARQRTPAYRRSTENLASCLAIVGRYEEAMSLYAWLAHEYPDSGRIALGTGYGALHSLDFEAATAAFARAEKLDPSLAQTAVLMRSAVGRAANTYAKRQGHPPPDTVDDARFFTLTGRAVDAERAWLAVARGSAWPFATRIEGLRYLAADGTPQAAEAAREAIERDGPIEPLLTRSLDAKRDRYRTIAALIPRIEKLAE